MSILANIMENEEFKTYLTENQELFLEGEQKVDDFRKVLKSFVLANPKEFLAENVDQIKKNIRVFTEVATAQYITEVSSMIGSELNISNAQESLEENKNDENTAKEDDYF